MVASKNRGGGKGNHCARGNAGNGLCGELRAAHYIAAKSCVFFVRFHWLILASAKRLEEG